MDLWWDEQDDCELLYAGCCDMPLASIHISNNKKWYGYLIEIPINTMAWKQYMPKDELKSAIEVAANRFFDLANTSRPAMERP